MQYIVPVKSILKWTATKISSANHPTLTCNTHAAHTTEKLSVITITFAYKL